MENLKRFWYEEEGMGTIEIVVIIVILLGLAFLFRNTITTFVKKLLARFIESGDQLNVDTTDEVVN